MPDPRDQLNGRYESNARFANFGNVVNKIVVKGIRCHSETAIELRSPITAFSGLNGTGKSTLLQLAASAYKSGEKYTVNSFLAKGPLDRSPFQDDATIQLFIQSADNPLNSLTLSYNPGSQRWQGYSRRKEREVFFFGVGFFLPQNERRDFVFRNSGALNLAAERELDNLVCTTCTKILSSGYDGIKSITVEHGTQKAEVLSTTKGVLTYSEAHMGCGEGRIQTLIRTLESCPEKSLILLEEPETSLHPKAEYELDKYLIDLCNRRGHQILIATHSERLMRALPQASLIHLHRHDGLVRPLPGIASHAAESLMTEGHDRPFTVLVEDEAAQIVLTELLRHHDLPFLNTVRIAIARHRSNGRIEASGKDAIRQAMKSLSEAGLKIAAVLDGDDEVDVANAIHKLPGDRAPEEELIGNAAVLQRLQQLYGIPPAELTTQLAEEDCHDYFDIIGRKVTCDPSFVLQQAACAYAGGIAPATARQLIDLLKEDAAR